MSAIPPIETDDLMGRRYIPLPGGWEIQTKGTGSTFRICDTKTGLRWPILDNTLHGPLEQMARAIHTESRPSPAEAELRKEVERLTDIHHRIRQWVAAYPIEVFPEPDFVACHAALSGAGQSLDAVSAAAMRHVVTKIAEILDQ